MNAAVVGCGVAGREHLAAYRSMAEVRVVAVCDTAEERARAAAGDGARAARVYTDVERLLDEQRCDLVSVCVPTVAHHDVTVAALTSGASVYCEKPLAMSFAEASAMYEAAHAAKRTIGVGFAMRWLPTVRHAREIVEGGTIGRVVCAKSWAIGAQIPWWGVHWQRAVSGGGFVASTAVHVLDAALWIGCFPSEPVLASASFARLYPEKRSLSAPTAAAAEAYDCEDTAAAHVRFADGSWLSLEGGWVCDAATERSGAEVVGIGGTVSLDPFSLVLERDGVPVDVTPMPPEDDYIAALAAGVRDAVQRVRDGRPPFVPEREALLVQRLVDAIYRSAELCREVEVEAA